MGQTLEAQLGGFALLPVDAVVVGIAAHGDIVQREVGQAQQQLAHPFLCVMGAGFQIVHLAAQSAHLLDDFRGGRLPGGAGVSYLAVDLVAAVAYLVGMRTVAPPGRVQFQQLVHWVIFAAGLHRLTDGLGVAPHLLNGNHSFQPLLGLVLWSANIASARYYIIWQVNAFS